MTLPTSANDTRSFSVVASRHRDGSVLLAASSDRVFKLNGVGALTWVVLEQSCAALSVDDVVQELGHQFETINAAGELQYDVLPEQLKQDTARFMQNLADNGLLQVVIDPNGRECYLVRENICGTTSTTIAEVNGTAADRSAEVKTTVPSSAASFDARADESAIRLKKRDTLIAFFGLFAFDLLLRVRGFQALIERVRTWPIAAPRATDFETCRHVCAMVNRAQVYYPKKAMCLQHSAVVTCLLRRKGVPAEMVLAAQEFPPKGHAWVEVDGVVVNDFRQVKTRYRELRRI